MKFRLASGGRVDRSKPVKFTFDGKQFGGYAGDTLASALIANGVHLVGRSFKYHRPRGFLSAGSDEPNALVGVGSDSARYTPNLRATQVELYDGLVAESQNRWPSLALDFGGINDLFSRLLSAGFYYKTFMWPAAAWKALYEPIIRKTAGLGKAPLSADPDRYTQVYAHCDVLIVGAGPAGLAAALAAGRSGLRVILCDEQDQLGGSLLSERKAIIEGEAAGGLARPGRTGVDLAFKCNAVAPNDRIWMVSAQFSRPVSAGNGPSRRQPRQRTARAHVASPRQRNRSCSRFDRKAAAISGQ